MVLFEALVEFKYDATEPDELSLQVGQVVKVIAEVDEGWWQGDLNGKIGVFPSNFVKKMERAKAPALPAAAAVPVAVPVAAAPVPAASGGSVRKVKVTHEYKANDEDELTLRVGDVITVLGDESEGWSKGEINGKFGTFPSNFAVEYKDEGEDQAPETKLKKIGVPTGGIGSLFGGGVPQLKKRNTVIDLKPAEPVSPPAPAQIMKKSPSFGGELKKEAAAPPPVTPSPAAAAAVPAATLKIRKARVTFAYEGGDEDELTLTVGEVLVVIGEEGEGWWRGTNAQGTTGVFPNNFVEEFWETIEAKPTPPKSVRPPAEAPKPAKLADPPKPAVASRLSRAEPADPTPAPAAAPLVNKPKPAPAPAADTSATNTGSTRPASPPPVFEKKKFNTPAAAAKPAAAAEVDGELLKKLSVRNAASESDAPPPSKPEPAPVVAAAAPPAAAAKPSPAGLPPKPAPIIAAAKPALAPPVAAAPAASLMTLNENDSGDSIDSPSEDSPKLHHATKDRPKIGSNRRKPQRRSFSAGSGSLPEEEGSDKPAEPVAAKPQLPTRSAAPASTESDPKLPERPKLAGKPSAQPSADPHTLPELKDWFQQELAALKRELQEERAARKALEDRLAKLEGGRR